MEDKERYQAAKKRVEDIKGFYIHLGLFVIVNLGLFAVNMLTTIRRDHYKGQRVVMGEDEGTLVYA